MNLIKSLLKPFFSPEQRAALRKPFALVLGFVFHGNLTKLAEIYQTDKTGSHWYTQHYTKHFRRFKYKRIKLLEIGVGGYDDPRAGGASLRVWKRYFPFGDIFAIDIHDKSALQENRIRILQGSQVDAAFLQTLCNEHGPFDIIIDDGSHLNEHIIETFKMLFPHVKDGGLYVIEDLQTSYWEDFGGDSNDLNNPRTAMNYLKGLTDCLNHQEIPNENYKENYFDKKIVGLHFYHNLVFIEKDDNDEPSNAVRNHRMAWGG